MDDKDQPQPIGVEVAPVTYTSPHLTGAIDRATCDSKLLGSIVLLGEFTWARCHCSALENDVIVDLMLSPRYAQDIKHPPPITVERESRNWVRVSMRFDYKEILDILCIDNKRVG